MKVYKDDVEKSKQRVEAWWNHEIIDRAVLEVTAPRGKAAQEEKVDDLERYFTDPELVIPRWLKALENTYFGGEAFPIMFPVYGGMVAILSNYLGCPMRFVDTHTVWAEPILEDYRTRPEYKFDPDNKWWKVTERLLKAGVEHADGYYVGIPDLNGPTEILARLRSPEKLAFDFIDNPQYIKPALKEINRAWLRYWKECTNITQATGGYFCWMGIWSDLPSIDLQSDFSCMISSEMFNEYFLPSIEEQTRWVDRTVYHLDGPRALQHLDALMDLPKLTGIQWVPGAGAKPTLEWIPVMKKIQDGGKLLYIYCEKENVVRLMKQLQPEGLWIKTICDSPEQAKALLKDVERATARR